MKYPVCQRPCGIRAALPTCGLLAAVLVIAATALPSPAWAGIGTHGIALAKNCSSPVRSCAGDLDCADGNECTDDVCDTSIPNVLNCIIDVPPS